MADPTSIWDYRQNFRYDEALAVDDPLRVELGNARGQYARDRLLRALGVDLINNVLRAPPTEKYILFGGHRGCGKSTELRFIADALTDPERFFVVFVDALKLLDINNLQYTDMVLAQATALVDALQKNDVAIDDVYLGKMRAWYTERIETSLQTRDLSAEVKTGAKAETGLPFLGKLFASLTTAIRTGATYKQEVRDRVRDSFSVLGGCV